MVVYGMNECFVKTKVHKVTKEVNVFIIFARQLYILVLGS